MDRKTVYIETSVVSYLTAQPTGDLLTAAWQKMTVDWWDTQRARFDLVTSKVTLDEASRGDARASARRLAAFSDIPVLPIVNAVNDLADKLVQGGALPAKSVNDALHVAVCGVHGVDYLLTWNCRHLDNAEAKPVIRRICTRYGYTSPEICTPAELMGGFEDGG